MELLNATNMQAGYTLGTQPDGRELLVVVVKGTYTIPDNPVHEPKLAEEQVPLVMTDEFTGEPGFSAPLYEIDFAPKKPRCDVLLNGSAHAPYGKPVERLTVSLRVGSWKKSFDVVGNRVWLAGTLSTGVSNPEPFTVMPISYNNAFGGVDRSQEDPSKHRWYLTNHVGVGYHEFLAVKYLDRKPLPNTEETGNPIKRPNGNYRPMAFGPLGRAWQQRVKLAGTYDQNWLDNQFPFLPTDFNEAYYQAAPADQQIEYPQGGEEVDLVNLTTQGRTTFKLPSQMVPFDFFYKNGDRKKIAGQIDTLLFEPDQGRFLMSWRVCLPFQRNLHEIGGVVAGSVSPDQPKEEESEIRMAGKKRYKSLAELAAANRAGSE